MKTKTIVEDVIMRDPKTGGYRTFNREITVQVAETEKTKVKVDADGKMYELNVAFGRHSPAAAFVFASYRDNPAFHDMTLDAWQVAATKGIHKWAAVSGHNLVGNVHREFGQPLNLMAEYA